MTAPATPPTQPTPSDKIYLGSTIFGWCMIATGVAFLFLNHAPSKWDHTIAAALMVVGGWCVDRTPLISLAQTVMGMLSAWRSR